MVSTAVVTWLAPVFLGEVMPLPITGEPLPVEEVAGVDEPLPAAPFPAAPLPVAEEPLPED
ncbi:hypothetical protein SB761_29185, partial [Pseudomonas sp. SIMBA_064]